MNSSDSLTVLRCHGAVRLAKRLDTAGAWHSYGSARTLDAFTIRVTGLADILALLQRMLPRSDCCAIRGELLAGDRATGIRRLLHPDKETGDAATIRDVARRWVALDLEGVALPADATAADLARCAEVAISTLPPELHGVACIVQATASHGFKPDMRLRLWFWLDRPIWGHELKRWLRGTPCDLSVFGAVQAIYTAAPILPPDMPDPIPLRFLAVPGRGVVTVPAAELLAPPPPPERSTGPVATPEQAHAYVREALIRAVHRISTTGEGGRHVAIVGQTSSLARFVASGLVPASIIADVVRAAARQAGKTDDGEIDAAIAWGLTNPWTDGPLPDARRGR